MKRIFTFCLLVLFSAGINAQWSLPATFEVTGEDTLWSVFANNNLPDPLEVVENPDVGGVNTSEWCCQVTIDAGATKWVGAWTNDYGPFVLSADSHHVEIMVYSDEPHIVGVRGQNPVDPGETGQYGFIGLDTMTKTNEWELLTFEYPDTMWYAYNTLTVFFDLDENRTEGSTLLWDNLNLIESPKFEYTMPVDFEQSPMEDTCWGTFDNNPDSPEDFALVDNPDKTGINTSDHCGIFSINATAEQWVGMWSGAYGYLSFTETFHTLEMMVYKDVIGPVGIRVQGGLEGAADVLVKVSNTKTNEWERLVFDFSEGIGNTYTNFVVFPDWIDEARTEASIFYFDNISLIDVSSVSTIENRPISIYPNPAGDQITVQYQGMQQLTITNIVGQQLRTIKFQPVDQRVVDISKLKSGIYFVTLESDTGIVSTKFIKK